MASCAFYPLWPLVMRGLAPAFGGSHLIAGLVVGNLCSLAAWVLFWQLVAWRFGSKVATWALTFLVAFPGSLFYQFLYSESLFFLLVMVLWWGLERGELRSATVAAFLLPLTRAVGVFALLPIAWAVLGSRLDRDWLAPIWRRMRSKPDDTAPESGNPNRPLLEGRYALLVAPLAGWACYLALMWHWTGNPFEGFQAQRYWGAHSIWNLLRGPQDGRRFFVAQISNLLQRRLPVGRLFAPRAGARMSCAGRRLETCDTADWKSALRAGPTTVVHPPVSPVINVPKFVAGFFSLTEWHDFRGSLVDRMAFVLLIYTLPLIWRRGRNLVVWTYVLGILPAMSGTFTSYTRYASTVFPVFIALGVFFAPNERRWFRYALLGGFAIGQIILAWRFVNFRWAG